MEEKPIGGLMLDFYRQHEVSPVRQEIADLQSHFFRRATLYQQLGIPRLAFSGRRVLEVGPGTGQNALFIAAQQPSEFVLVEPNPTSRREIGYTFHPFPVWYDSLSVSALPIEEFTDASGFEFVLCEGLVGASGHPEPSALVATIASQVKPGGVLVLTCLDYVGYLSEMLRRLIAFELSGKQKGLASRVAALTPVFAPHLKRLEGVTRRTDDWIIDNLINPAAMGELVSFADCIRFLDRTFDVLATSPRFVTDWTWYKKASLEQNFFNRTALDSYSSNLHNFLDCRLLSSKRSQEDNRILLEICKRIHQQIKEFEKEGAALCKQRVAQELGLLQRELKEEFPSTAAAVEEVRGWLIAPAIEPTRVAMSEHFGAWFGRAQTYVSLVRRQT